MYIFGATLTILGSKLKVYGARDVPFPAQLVAEGFVFSLAEEVCMQGRIRVEDKSSCRRLVSCVLFCSNRETVEGKGKRVVGQECHRVD